jgi:hypothetical protein
LDLLETKIRSAREAVFRDVAMMEEGLRTLEWFVMRYAARKEVKKETSVLGDAYETAHEETRENVKKLLDIGNILE